ncbi:MAG: CHAT domain-containing protein [Sphingobacteriales bacterium]|nr:MAG: CHAT domain-containing protein [Sphingobacteriales bacterium]
MKESDLINQANLKLKEQDLQKQIILQANNPTALLEIYKKMYDVLLEKEDFEKRIKASRVPVNHEIRINSIDDCRSALLRNHQALIEIFVGDSSVYVLFIMKQTAILKKISATSYETLTRAMMQGLTRPSSFQKDFDAYVNASLKLYNLLFNGIEIPPGRIIVSPDGEYFPFEALVQRYHKSGVTYLLHTNAISYTYSAKFSAVNNSHVAVTDNNFLGFAPVKYQSNIQLSSLLHSDASMRNISARFSNPKSYLFSEATRANFINNFSNYKIIHLYSHAASNATTGDPVLYFSDSALYLRDLIIRNKPKTSLIILAACESGIGKLYLGEGVFSFNRAFASMGIPSAIVNLWTVYF